MTSPPDTSHITSLEGMRESLNTVELENSNLRKLLFEAVKRLDTPRRLEIIAMVKGKSLVRGGFTSCDWGAAEEFDEWKKLFEDCANALQAVIDAPGPIVREHNPRGADLLFHQLKITNEWFQKADTLAERCRSHGIKMKRETTLEEILDNKDH